METGERFGNDAFKEKIAKMASYAACSKAIQGLKSPTPTLMSVLARDHENGGLVPIFIHNVEKDAWAEEASKTQPDLAEALRERADSHIAISISSHIQLAVESILAAAITAMMTDLGNKGARNNRDVYDVFLQYALETAVKNVKEKADHRYQMTIDGSSTLVERETDPEPPREERGEDD